jgi:hypothetical protein
MGSLVLFADRASPMSPWCLVTLIIGCAMAAMGMKLEQYENSKRIVQEAIAKALKG